jgi:alcohol dehydrogenase (cytochrome c)
MLLVGALLGGALLLLRLPGLQAQQEDEGRKTFEARCAACHGADGAGAEMGPAIRERLSKLTDAELTKIITDGLSAKGMPPNVIDAEGMKTLVRFLRSIQRAVPPVVRRTIQIADGGSLTGDLIGEGLHDLQLRTDDKALHLFRRAGDRFRAVTSDADWPTYNGDPRGNRFTTLTQINKETVGRLAPSWLFSIPDAGQLQVTPIVAGGIMYVTARNEIFALDAGSGRRLWHYKRPATKGATVGHANRGAGVAGDRVFLMTDHAHLLALNRFTGQLLWDTPLDDWRKNYSATSAPLPAGNLVISGVTGGEHGANGFVAAFDQESGKEVWRYWTVPKPGEPGSETWQGSDIDHGGAPTWFTGSYDPALDLVYWPTGNPAKEYSGDDRKGDNLYANSILALDHRSGKLRWYYQFIPHDLWDWDATQTSVLVDTEWQGKPRRLMLHASRNGFFYVFDRERGTLLLAKPFVKHLTWASGIGADGRPIKLPNQEPSEAGTKVCPSQDGATNWFSPSYNPATGLYYLQTFEKCGIYTRRAQGPWESGKTFLGGSHRIAPDPTPQRILRAIDIRTGAIAWELPQAGPGNSWGGTLATASGLVIAAEDGGALIAVDAGSGKLLWSFQTNQTWKASPMAYMFDGKQHIAVAADGNIIAFALRE